MDLETNGEVATHDIDAEEAKQPKAEIERSSPIGFQYKQEDSV